MYQCVRGDAPKYLSDMLTMTHGHHLRTSTFNKLPISRSNIAQVHNGSFKSVGPRMWNILPNDITSCNTMEAFKRKLDTPVQTIVQSDIMFQLHCSVLLSNLLSIINLTLVITYYYNYFITHVTYVLL